MLNNVENEMDTLKKVINITQIKKTRSKKTSNRNGENKQNFNSFDEILYVILKNHYFETYKVIIYVISNRKNPTLSLVPRQ